jgi:hypothetical protein
MKTKKKLLLTFAILFIALISGCAKDDFVEIDGVCPLVISTIPTNEATNVPLDQVITATFNEEMNPATINQSSFTLIGSSVGSSQLAGKITYSGLTATFTPSALLTPNTTYSARITRTVKDLTGNALQTDYIWTFSTGLTIRPMVTFTDPADKATNVPLNKLVSVNFNMPMKASTIINPTTYTLKQGTTAVSGIVTYSGTTAIFTPAAPLAPNTEYTATVSKAATNLDNNSLTSDYVWKFTTGALVAPTVISTDPIDGATGVSLNKTITATFSTPMNGLTITTGTTFTLTQGTTVIPGAVTYSGITASFNPTNPLLEGKEYTATITTAAKDLAGTALANDKVWRFTTGVITPIPVGSTLGVFGGSAGITNQGLFTRINNGSISTTAAATKVTGFHDVPNNIDYTVTSLNEGLANGGIIVGTAATTDYNTALALFNSISPASKPGGADISTVDLGGQILTKGIYTSASTIKITGGDLTLNGNASDVWIFQAGSSLTVGDSAPVSVKLTGGALAKNVYWYVKGTAVINYAGGGVMVGTIAAESGVTLSNPANSTNAAVTTLNGKAISIVASVTMVNTVINIQ